MQSYVYGIIIDCVYYDVGNETTNEIIIVVERISRPQVDLTFERFRFLAPCQRLRAIVCVLSAHLRRVLKSTCVCLRFREQCLRSEITSVSRVALVLLLRFVAINMDVNTPASKRSQLIGNTAIVRKRCVIHTNSTCVCWRLSVATFTQKRKDASFDLWQHHGYDVKKNKRVRKQANMPSFTRIGTITLESGALDTMIPAKVGKYDRRGPPTRSKRHREAFATQNTYTLRLVGLQTVGYNY